MEWWSCTAAIMAGGSVRNVGASVQHASSSSSQLPVVALRVMRKRHASSGVLVRLPLSTQHKSQLQSNGAMP